MFLKKVGHLRYTLLFCGQFCHQPETSVSSGLSAYAIVPAQAVRYTHKYM